MKRILVTGCNGFVGSHICERLVKSGHRVIGLDTAPYRWKDGFYQTVCGENFCNLEGDLTDLQFVQSLVEDQKPQIVIHLASVVGVNLYIEDPMKVIDVNILGLRNLLKGAGPGWFFPAPVKYTGETPRCPGRKTRTACWGRPRYTGGHTAPARRRPSTCCGPVPGRTIWSL